MDRVLHMHFYAGFFMNEYIVIGEYKYMTFHILLFGVTFRVGKKVQFLKNSRAHFKRKWYKAHTG